MTGLAPDGSSTQFTYPTGIVIGAGNKVQMLPTDVIAITWLRGYLTGN